MTHDGGMLAALDRWRDDLRPLDPVRSIKAKLGLLVAVSVAATAVLTWYGLLILGWHPRYTLPVAIVVTLALTQLLAHGMTAPLRQMTAAAQAMAVGRTPAPVRATSRDEVGELARAFTAMAGELAVAQQQRRELLANVGHELRTPVAALRAQLENLADGVRPADSRALEEVLDQVQRLGTLLSDLLDLARADSGAVPLHRRSVRVGDIVTDVVQEVAAVFPARRMQVQVDPALEAYVDPQRLRQLLVNLVHNAARHAPEGGLVAVQADLDATGGLVLEVTDDGPGIPPSRWESVFERFHRGSTGELPVLDFAAARTATGDPPADGGTGLGLAIARWVVVLHGGRIAVVPPDGTGCRIRAELPAH